MMMWANRTTSDSPDEPAPAGTTGTLKWVSPASGHPAATERIALICPFVRPIVAPGVSVLGEAAAA